MEIPAGCPEIDQSLRERFTMDTKITISNLTVRGLSHRPYHGGRARLATGGPFEHMMGTAGGPGSFIRSRPLATVGIGGAGKLAPTLWRSMSITLDVPIGCNLMSRKAFSRR